MIARSSGGFCEVAGVPCRRETVVLVRYRSHTAELPVASVVWTKPIRRSKAETTPTVDIGYWGHTHQTITQMDIRFVGSVIDVGSVSSVIRTA